MISFWSQEDKCTIIESLYGEVKLIKRSCMPPPALLTLRFSSLTDCLEYVDRNRFHINVLYSGRKKTEDGKK